MEMINLRNTLNEVHRLLLKEKIHHALIGGLAMAAYGEFRATSDVDFLAEGSKKEIIKKYADLFSEWDEIQKIKDVVE